MDNILSVIHSNQDIFKNYIELFNSKVATIKFDIENNQLSFKIVSDVDKIFDKNLVEKMCQELKTRKPNSKYEDEITITFYDDIFKAPEFSAVNGQNKNVVALQENLDAFLCAFVPGYKFMLRERLKKEYEKTLSKSEELNKKYTITLSSASKIVNSIVYNVKNDENE